MTMLAITVECKHCHEHVDVEVSVVARSTDDGPILLGVEPAEVPHTCEGISA